MDAIEVYLGTQLSGSTVEAGPEPVTGLTLTAPEEPDAKHTLNFVAMRSSGPYASTIQAGRVEELDGGVVEAYIPALMRSRRVPVKRRYELLTLENFATIKDSVEGYDRVIARVSSDAELRAWYREALTD